MDKQMVPIVSFSFGYKLGLKKEIANYMAQNQLEYHFQFCNHSLQIKLFLYGINHV